MGVPGMTTSWEGQKHHASVGRRAVSEAHAAREILSPPPPPRVREGESDCRGEGPARGTLKLQSFKRPPTLDALHSAQGREKHASIRRAEAQEARELCVYSM